MGSEVPFFILRMKYFSKAILARCTQYPSPNQFTLRGGIWGRAMKAAPRSPKSARHTAFQVAFWVGLNPSSMARMLWAVAVTIDSIMKPVLGTPVGTGVGSVGAMATHTPTANTFG